MTEADKDVQSLRLLLFNVLMMHQELNLKQYSMEQKLEAVYQMRKFKLKTIPKYREIKQFVARLLMVKDVEEQQGKAIG